VPSALAAALIVRRLTGLPLVADLRDPIVYETWPARTWDRRVYSWLERRVVRAASAVVLTTPRACEMYRLRYTDLPAERFCEIANGIDEASECIATRGARQAVSDGPILLLHSGLMELPDRDPTAFFKALRLLVDEGSLATRTLRIVLRASGREAQYRAMAETMGVGALVSLELRSPYAEALAEMQSATGLLLFQGSACNRQIPAKVYEYLASGRPIIGLMDPHGDTHALVHGKWGVPYCADMADPEAIARMLVRFLADVEAGRAYVPPAALVKAYSRRSQAGELARVLDRVVMRGVAGSYSGPDEPALEHSQPGKR
jgi:glycosyltransferase involved in cell wall biosynthesis